MTDDLIARLRLHAELCEPSAKTLRRVLAEAADALEAAREDAERLGRAWYMGPDGVKRWADTDEPVERGD